jgi:hypothetical protein
MGSRKTRRISRTEEILSGIRTEARLQTEHDRWLGNNPGGSAPGLLAEIASVRQQYAGLMTVEERAAAFPEKGKGRSDMATGVADVSPDGMGLHVDASYHASDRRTAGSLRERRK